MSKAKSKSKREQLEAVLDGLIDHESEIRDALAKDGHNPSAVAMLCDSLRTLIYFENDED